MDIKLHKNIENQVKDWTSKNLGNNFRFRESQFEKIVDIVYNIVDKTTKTQIVEAPTGSGKSIIILVSAGVLADYYDLESYVLCSDLFLFSQYEDFINKHNLNIGTLKGITGNYVCKKHKCYLSEAPCKVSQTSYRKLKIFGGCQYDCSLNCNYMKSRKKLVNSKVGVMTYSLFLFQMNICGGMNAIGLSHHSPAVIYKRPIIFCDEAHKIPTTLQMFVSPFISPKNDFPIYKEIINYVFKNKSFDYDDYFGKLNECYENLRNEEDVFKIWYNYKGFCGLLKTVKSCANIVSKTFSEREYDSLTPYEKFVLSKCNHFENMMCYLNDFLSAIEMTHPKYLIKNNQKNGINFNCVLESVLVKNYLLKHSDFQVMTSATIGNVDNFCENCGICDYKFTKMDSNFNFNNSPIIYIDGLKMSQNHLKNSLDDQIERLKTILDKHKNDKGIIHSASYKLSKTIYEKLPDEYKKRLIMYKDSKIKNNSIENFKTSKNGVLVGPSIIEGLDLPDDLCRFNIIFKIPFPSMGDKYVSRKMRIYKKWYNSQTTTNVIQSLGRGIRHKNDECKCYILDGCLKRLKKLTKDQWPKEFNDRFIEISSSEFSKIYNNDDDTLVEVV